MITEFALFLIISAYGEHYELKITGDNSVIKNAYANFHAVLYTNGKIVKGAYEIEWKIDYNSLKVMIVY